MWLREYMYLRMLCVIMYFNVLCGIYVLNRCNAFCETLEKQLGAITAATSKELLSYQNQIKRNNAFM